MLQSSWQATGQSAPTPDTTELYAITSSDKRSLRCHVETPFSEDPSTRRVWDVKLGKRHQASLGLGFLCCKSGRLQRSRRALPACQVVSEELPWVGCCRCCIQGDLAGRQRALLLGSRSKKARQQKEEVVSGETSCGSREALQTAFPTLQGSSQSVQQLQAAPPGSSNRRRTQSQAGLAAST